MGGVHYHPEGALCWFSCNKYGETTGEVVYIRKVPIEGLMFAFKLKREYRMRNFNKKKEFKELFYDEPRYEIKNTVKPRLCNKKGKPMPRDHPKKKKKATNKTKEGV